MIAPAKPSAAPQARPTARWMRDSASGVLAARRVGLFDSREDIRRVWDRVSAIAMDLIQNSGRLKGACDQVLADTIGDGLKLNARPDLARLGYTPAEAAEFAQMLESRWKRYAENPDEVDFRGKFDLHQLVDVALRHFVAYGEATGVIDFLAPAQRRGYGITTGTKLLLVAPHRLTRETNEAEGLHTGVIHDPNGRAIAYRFRTREGGIEQTKDYAARDRDGRTLVIHAFDPWDAADVRGISVLASAMRTQAMAEQLGDATLATAILQTVFAATLTSPEPSAEAFQAIEQLEDFDEGLKEDFIGYFGARMDKARESSIAITGSQVSHLAPGEDLKLHTAATPGSNYLPFSADLRREMARAIGVTYESISMDHSDATYSSVRMGISSIWPVVMRRRRRIAAPIYQTVYESWLDEQIGSGRIPLRGGYAAFRANREAVTWAEWQGPPKPSADDNKSAKAATERLQNGTTTLSYECAEYGLDWRDVLRQRSEELQMLTAAGLPNPFERAKGGGAPAEETPAQEGVDA